MRSGIRRGRPGSRFDDSVFREAVRQTLVLEDWLESTWPEFEECEAGRCAHREAGLSCELENQREETVGTVDAVYGRDASTALFLARKYERPEDRPEDWSFELWRAVNLATAEDARFRRLKIKAAGDEIERRIRANGNSR